ncbi:MAG: MFS transporter [Gammaproteobacteria bacterium]|nr:MFS transporter [Gammaproteobacteria bacterium]
MLDTLKKTLSPLVGLFIFALCSGFFLTLLSLAMHAHDESPLLIGMMTGMFYAGLVFGSFHLEPFIVRVGHIRAFSAFASALAVMSLLHGIFYHMPLWLLLRFLTGFGTAGIFIVIESWLLSNSTDATRGRIVSLYMITFYASEALGQLLINLGGPNDFILYGIAAMLCSLSVIPLTITRAPIPQLTESLPMKLRTLYKKTTSALFGCFLAGMILSAAYGLFPILFSETYHDTSKVSVIMFCLIFGGMLLQYPVGKCSDLFDRRLVVIVISLSAVIASAVLMRNITSYIHALILITLLGGFATTIYPICISYACDKLDNKDILSGIRGLLLAYSLGSTIGPFIAPVFMHGVHETYLFFYFIFAFAVTASLFTWQKIKKESPTQEEPFQIMRQTTPVLAEGDSRTEPE